MEKIYPYGKNNELVLKGNWVWGAEWEFFQANKKPQGLPTTSAICILLCADGIVLTKTTKGGWELTGGRCDISQDGTIEPVYSALKREVLEEAGANLVWFTEIGVKVIYNPKDRNIINSENGLPFPKKAFQEYFIGWCSIDFISHTGEEVLESKVFNPKDLNYDLLKEMPEPFEFLYLLNKFIESEVLIYNTTPLELIEFVNKYKKDLKELEKGFQSE